MKVLVFGGALRKGSFNRKFALNAFRFLEKQEGVQAEFIDLKDFNIPVYDGDVEAAEGIPAGVVKLGEKVRNVDALVISTPEYNGSIPGALKNVIDWLSREKQVSLEGKHLLLLAASPGYYGGERSLWHTRQPLTKLLMHVYPEMLGLSKANEAFDEDDNLKEERWKSQLEKLITKYLNYVRVFTN